MTGHDELGLHLRRHFLSTADTRTADGQLDAVLARTRVSVQRPAWLVAARGGLVGASIRPPLPGLRLVLLVGAMLLALVVAAVLLGGQRAPAFGAGLLAFSRDGRVFIARPDGSDAVLVADDPGVNLRVAGWSSDGTRLALAARSAVYVFEPSSATARFVAAGSFVGWAGGDVVVEEWPEGLRRVTLDGDTVGRYRRLRLAAVSPDGRLVAGVRDGQLLVVDLASSVEVALGTTPAGTYAARSDWDLPTWSPDSRQVAFVVSGRGTKVVFGQGTMVGVAAVDGTVRSDLRPTDGRTGFPSWSPDGQWIAYLREERLELIRPDGTDQRVLAAPVGEPTTGALGLHRFQWTPDGASITYFAPDGALATLDLATGRTIDMTSLGAGLEAVAWQPVPIGRPVPPLPAPRVADPQATSVPIGEPPPGPPAEPATGWRGLLVRGLVADGGPDDGLCKAAFVDFATRATIVEARTQESGFGCSSWSPSGGLRVEGPSEDILRILRRDGTEVASLRAREAGLGRIATVRWSPGGGWLLAEGCAIAVRHPSASPAGGFGASCVVAWFIVRADGTDIRSVPAAPVWSTGDERMAVSLPDGTLAVGSGDGSDLRSTGVAGQAVGWSPDVAALAFLVEGDVWTMGADGTNGANLTAFALRGATDAAWSPAGGVIAVVQGDSLWVISTDGAMRRRLELAGSPRPGLRWSPDGRHLAVGVDDVATGPTSTVLLDLETWHAVELRQAFPSAWSPDSAFLLLGLDDPSRDSIDVVRADGSGRRSVSDEPGDFDESRWVP